MMLPTMTATATILLSVLLACITALLSVIAFFLKRLIRQIDSMNEKVVAGETSFIKISSAINIHEKRLDNHENRIDQLHNEVYKTAI